MGRVYHKHVDDPQRTVIPHLEPGDYGQDSEGLWWIMTPTNWMGPLRDHTVEEHEDGTITVRPSILTPCDPDNPRYYHGWLTRGEWSNA